MDRSGSFILFHLVRSSPLPVALTTASAAGYKRGLLGDDEAWWAVAVNASHVSQPACQYKGRRFGLARTGPRLFVDRAKSLIGVSCSHQKLFSRFEGIIIAFSTSHQGRSNLSRFVIWPTSHIWRWFWSRIFSHLVQFYIFSLSAFNWREMTAGIKDVAFLSRCTWSWWRTAFFDTLLACLQIWDCEARYHPPSYMGMIL